MRSWDHLEIEPQGEGISPELSLQINLLGSPVSYTHLTLPTIYSV